MFSSHTNGATTCMCVCVCVMFTVRLLYLWFCGACLQLGHSCLQVYLVIPAGISVVLKFSTGFMYHMRGGPVHFIGLFLNIDCLSICYPSYCTTNYQVNNGHTILMRMSKIVLLCEEKEDTEWYKRHETGTLLFEIECCQLWIRIKYSTCFFLFIGGYNIVKNLLAITKINSYIFYFASTT